MSPQYLMASLLLFTYLENSCNSLSSCHLVLRSAPVTDTWKQKQNLSTRTHRLLRWIINACHLKSCQLNINKNCKTILNIIIIRAYLMWNIFDFQKRMFRNTSIPLRSNRYFCSIVYLMISYLLRFNDFVGPYHIVKTDMEHDNRIFRNFPHIVI